MGAWGLDVFENDAACDWVYDLESKGADHISATLESVLSVGNEFLAADIGSQGLAAVEVVARLLGQPGQSGNSTESLDAWLASNSFTPSADLTKAAVATIEAVLGAKSELAELWAEEPESSAQWRESVEGLRRRLELPS